MAGSLIDNVKAILEDFKGSWYFRVWGSLWGVCAVMVFVVLILLGGRSDRAGQEKEWRFWIENASSITFPKFHFRIMEDGQTFIRSTMVCSHSGMTLHNQQCLNGDPGMTTCFALGDSIVSNALTAFDNGNNRIDCKMNTTATLPTQNLMMAWEIEGGTGSMGGTSDTVYVQPNNMAWILLQKTIIQPLNVPGASNGYEAWNKDLVYHSSEANPGFYQISVILNNFRVDHIEQVDGYNGWMALGGIGGFAFFMLILHTLIMIVVGIFLTNDSKFLRGGASSYSGGGFDSERTPIMEGH